MAEVAEYDVLMDDPFTLALNQAKTFTFNLPTDLPETHREILSWVMVDSVSPGAAHYSMTLNGQTILNKVPTPPDPDRRGIQEVIEKDVKIKTGPGASNQNTLTVTNVSATDGATVRMSDIVLWYHRI